MLFTYSVLYIQFITTVLFHNKTNSEHREQLIATAHAWKNFGNIRKVLMSVGKIDDKIEEIENFGLATLVSTNSIVCYFAIW